MSGERARLLAVGFALFLILAALATPFNHDETQYYAAAKLAAGGMPYRDFIYLQTPLFAWWGALLSLLADGWLLIVGRITQALMGIVVIALVYRIALRESGSRDGAVAGAVVIGASYPFLFAATVFRNDILPMLLETLALAVLLPVTRAGVEKIAARLFVGGMLIGLAGSAKVNFILLGIAPALCFAMRGDLPWRRRLVFLVILALGGLTGSVPIFLSLLPAPDEAYLQIVTFGSEAPQEWYRLTGQGWRLTPWGRAADALVVLLQGPALLVLLAIALVRGRTGGYSSRQGRFLDLFVLAGLAAALVPAPVWRQYFVVLLPPLALRLATLWPFVGGSRKMRVAFATFVVVGSVIGLVRSGSGLFRLPDTIVSREIVSHRMAEKLDGAGPVATLSPEFVVDSGAPLDPAFAAGPFVYRWSRSSEYGAVNAANLAAHLDAVRPAAIITGQESDSESTVQDLDRLMRDWAGKHGYRKQPSGDGETAYYFAPLVGDRHGS